MVTGASTADLALILVDATKGVTTQSRRHAFIASLLAIPHMIVVDNKMDLVGYSEATYSRIRAEFTEFAAKLTVQDVSFIPVSALEGDNVVRPSVRMPWHLGGPLLHQLESVKVGARRNMIDFRFSVQHVIQTGAFRGYAGTVASGSMSSGSEVVVLPSGLATRIRSVETSDGPVPHARVGDAVVLTTEDALDISRGDMIVRAANLPVVTNRLDAYLCWMDTAPLKTGATYLLTHTTRQVHARVDRVDYRVDVDTLHRSDAHTLGLNDIGRVLITTTLPLFVDSYRLNSATGSFVVIDPYTHATVAAGMVRGEPKEIRHVGHAAHADRAARSTAATTTSRAAREARHHHKAAVIWLTGLRGSGKSTLARRLEQRL